MAVILAGTDLGKSYGPRLLFEGISFDLSDGERMGMIGPNGSGKSTLLKILAGDETPDHGERVVRNGVRLGYLPQDDVFPPGLNVEQVLVAALANTKLEDYERITQAGIVLGKVGFTDLQQQVDTLSGGWRKRLAIARALVLQPDVLLLDEPTNHLDLEGILWLEKLLKGANFAFLLVSHDRYLLENVTNRVMELNRVYPQGFFRAAGAYSDFLTRREEFMESQLRQQDNLANQVRREVEWLRRGPKARTSKSHSRIEEAGRMISELSALNERNSQGRTAEIEFSATDRVANKLLSVEEISKGFGGRPLFSGLSFILAPGTRMGLIGGNGSGKTTLLRILTGELSPDSGTVRRASRLRVVWFDQARQQLDKTLTLRQALCAQGDSVIYRGNSVHVVAWAKRFLFRTEQLDMQLSKLSGGEQARTLIANLMLQPADLLLLDEPTNDLDIATLEVLEDSLSDFPGAIVLITHDRYLLSRLSTEVLGLDGHGGARVFGDLEQWEAARQAANSAASSKEAPAKSTRAAAPAARPARLSYKESRELEGMQARITAAEVALAACHQEVERAAAGGDYKQLHACSDALQAAQATVDELYQRWEELESKGA